MEYFNRYSPEYLAALKTGNGHYKIRLEILSQNETAVGEITKDISLTAQGQITINYEQITRRSCSLTLIDVDGKYLPHKNSPFWINRKFKLLIGLVVGDDIYWWSQGVFYTLSATASNRTLSIEGVDKGAALDGTLKLNMTDVEYVIQKEDNLTTTIKQLMALDVGSSTIEGLNDIVYGGDQPIDVKEPLVGVQYFGQKAQSDITVDANNYVGEIFTKLADLYGADCYYDTEGYFNFVPYMDNYGYNYAPKQWEFNDLSVFYEDVNYNYSYDGENVVTYYTNSSDTGVANVLWTSYNTNPLSPINVGTGIRRAPSQEMVYYAYDSTSIDEEREQNIQNCKAAANHYLTKSSLVGMQLTFNSPIIPHMDVNKTIGICDSWAGIDDGVFIVQSITIPLSAGKMSISATNINWLPNDMGFEGTSAVIDPEIIYTQTDESDYIYITDENDSQTVLYTGSYKNIKMPTTLDNKALTTVGCETFYETNVERVIIPEGVTTIE